jgi:hypothetical protein
LRNAYRIFVGETGRDYFGYIIKIDLKEMGCEAVDWFHLAQDKDQWRAAI